MRVPLILTSRSRSRRNVQWCRRYRVFGWEKRCCCVDGSIVCPCARVHCRCWRCGESEAGSRVCLNQSWIATHESGETGREKNQEIHREPGAGMCMCNIWQLARDGGGRRRLARYQGVAPEQSPAVQRRGECHLCKVGGFLFKSCNPPRYLMHGVLVAGAIILQPHEPRC